MNFYAGASIILALIVSLTAPYVIRPLLVALRVIDVPNSRSSHTKPVLRGAGIAPLLGFLVGVAFLQISIAAPSGRRALLVVLIATAAVSSLGLVEDLWGVPIIARAGVQLLVGTLATLALVAITDSDWVWVPIGGIAFAGYTNAANFMDGINGVSSLHGVGVGVSFAVIGALVDIGWLVPAGLVLAASFVAFLPWNLMREGLFLGDVGSYLLGGSIGVLAIAAGLAGAPVIAITAPLAIYLADTGTTLIKRIVRGDEWQHAHRSHVYQRLTDSGHSHVTVACVVTGATLIASGLGLLSLTDSVAGNVLAICGIAVVCTTYLALPLFLGSTASLRTEPRDPERAFNPADSEFAVAHRGSKWAVVGASGFIGRALVAELRAQGFEVACVVAPRLRLSDTATAVETLERLEQTSVEVASLACAISGVDVVVNAAGLAAPDSAADEQLFGANALLPLVVVRAAAREHVARVVHLSSAAVQGRRMVLDESSDTSPFSPYSRSKALAEEALMSFDLPIADSWSPDVVIVRATSVQGQGRETTERLRRLARSRIACVAQPGDRPTVVSSLQGLVEFLIQVGLHKEATPAIVLQPWEGMTTASVLEAAGGRIPLKLPVVLCRAVVTTGFMVGFVLPRMNGLVRRLELMLMGQRQDAAWARVVGIEHGSYVARVLEGARIRS